MDIDSILRLVIEMRASDLHLKAHAKPVLRVDGHLVQAQATATITADDLEQIFLRITNEEQQTEFKQAKELDFAYSLPGLARFRVNAAWQRGTIALSFRAIPVTIPRLESLGLPPICQSLALRARGLVLVTGPTGSGKSTTLAAMIEHLNETEERRVVSIEDPIEFLHRDNKCFITQREVGSDTRSFPTALRHALRQDPDVILVGEMRDLETIATAITAAETGHLVFGTLHTMSAAQTVDRLVDVFPPYQQQQIRMQLSLTLEGVISQVLLPLASGRGRVAAAEVMLMNNAARNLVREGKSHQLLSVIQTGASQGMCSLDQSLRDLVVAGKVSMEEALLRANKQAELRELIRATSRAAADQY